MGTTTSSMNNSYEVGPENNFGADIKIPETEVQKPVLEEEVNTKVYNKKKKTSDEHKIEEVVKEDTERLTKSGYQRAHTKVVPESMEFLPRTRMTYDVKTISKVKKEIDVEIASLMKEGYDVHGMSVENNMWHVMLVKVGLI